MRSYEIVTRDGTLVGYYRVPSPGYALQELAQSQGYGTVKAAEASEPGWRERYVVRASRYFQRAGR